MHVIACHNISELFFMLLPGVFIAHNVVLEFFYYSNAKSVIRDECEGHAQAWRVTKNLKCSNVFK